jgi:hypothetical protein
MDKGSATTGWTAYELDGLVTRTISCGQIKILPRSSPVACAFMLFLAIELYRSLVEPAPGFCAPCQP